MDPRDAGRVARSLEPLHALCYFAPEVAEEAIAAGVPKGRATYFAPRSAAMGRVGAGPVAATFYVFNPEQVQRHVPSCWETADPAEVVASRYRGVSAAYRRLLGPELLESAEVAEAAELARTASTGCTPEGRALYAAHAELEWPTEPHLVLWHALTLIREHRGDGHVAALVSAGLSGLEALITHTATGKGFTVPAAQATRGFTEAEWTAAVAGLAERGLMSTETGALTDDGVALRRSVERQTEVSAVAAWDALGEQGTQRLGELGQPLVHTALTNGAFPPNVFA